MFSKYCRKLIVEKYVYIAGRTIIVKQDIIPFYQAEIIHKF